MRGWLLNGWLLKPWRLRVADACVHYMPAPAASAASVLPPPPTRRGLAAPAGSAVVSGELRNDTQKRGTRTAVKPSAADWMSGVEPSALAACHQAPHA